MYFQSPLGKHALKKESKTEGQKENITTPKKNLLFFFLINHELCFKSITLHRHTDMTTVTLHYTFQKVCFWGRGVSLFPCQTIAGEAWLLRLCFAYPVCECVLQKTRWVCCIQFAEQQTVVDVHAYAKYHTETLKLHVR